MSAADTERRFINLECKVGELTRRPFAVPPGSRISVKRHGAKADAHRVRDAAMTNGSAVLTSASALFERSDVGLTVGVEGAGASGAPLVTTIAGYTSATQVTLAVAASTTVSGKVAVWGTDNTAAFQAAIDAAAALPGSAWYSNRTVGAGGGAAFAPDGSYLCGPLTFPNRSGLVGLSERVMLYMLPGMAGHFLRNVAAAQLIVLERFTIIGNRELQTAAVDGIYLDSLAAIDYTRQEEDDAQARLRGIYMDRMPGNGFSLHGRGDSQVLSCHVRRSVGNGYLINMDDCYLTDCVAAATEQAGFYVARGGGRIVSAKAWYSGGLGSTAVALKNFETGATILDDASNPLIVPGYYVQSHGSEMAGCEAQDTLGSSLVLSDARHVAIAAFHADSCGRATGSQEAAIRLHNTIDCVIQGVVDFRFLNDDGSFSYAQNQSAHAIRSTGSSANNQIALVTHGLSSTPVDPASTAIVGNTISLANQDGSQTITSYIPLIDPAVDGAQTLLSSNTPLTPDPSLGREISITLANNITLNAPTSAAYGDVLTLKLTQDATGGRAVTWDAIYVDEAQPTATASTETVFRLIYDGANWRVSYNTSAAAIWRPVDPYAGGTALLDLQNNVELAAPTPSHVGMRLTFVVEQAGATPATLTWNAAYQTTWQPTQALGSLSTISFVYDGSKWLPIMAEAGAAPAAHAPSHHESGSDPLTISSIAGTLADSQLSANVPLKNVANTLTENLSIDKATGNALVLISGLAGSTRSFAFYTAGVARWLFSANATAEGGANSGTDFAIVRYNDAGAVLSQPFIITRATGYVGIRATAPHTWLHVNGPIATAYAAKIAAYTVTANDSIIAADATAGAFTVTLPTAASIAGREYTVKKTDSSANAVTVDGAGAETIDGAATYSLAARWSTVTVVSDGANWLIKSKF